jgi:hypothetical protein
MSPTTRSQSSMLKSDEMSRTMRRIAMRNNRSRAMSEKATQHLPHIIVSVRNYVKVIIKTLAWYTIVLEMPDDCTVYSLKKNRREIGLSHQTHLPDPKYRVMNANYRNLKDYQIVDGTLIHFLRQFNTLKGIMTDEFDVYSEIDYV